MGSEPTKPNPTPAPAPAPVAAPKPAPVTAVAKAAPVPATPKPAPAPAPAAAPKAVATPATPKPAPAPKPTAAAPKPAVPVPAPAAKAPAGFKLPAAVYSPQLLESVIYDIQYYLDWYRQNQIRKTVGAKPKDEPNHSDETVLVIEAWLAGKPPTLETLEELLNYLRKLKLPEVHIMLAALPNRSQREALVSWFRSNATSELLVSFVADRNLGGGLVVRTPNHVLDYSWKQQLVVNRDKLAGILKRV